MRKYDYFIGSLKAQAHYSREWMLRAMSVVIDDVKARDPKWLLRHTAEEVQVYVPNEQGWGWEALEGAKPYDIPFIYHDETGPIKSGDLDNLNRDIENGTWGDLIFNSRVLVYAAGSLIDYQEGPIDLGSIEQIFVKRMVDDPKGDDVPGQLYVKHWLRFGKAIGDLAGYEMFVPSVTEKALQSPANNAALRDELFEQYKNQLDDPVVQSKIQDKLVANYKDTIKGDPSEGFLYKKKSLNTALKRMFLIHGPEAGFSEGGRATLIKNSLEEGLDTTKYPDMVNSLRAGSFFRGALTAVAGEDVDLMGRIFQNAKIVPGFCGTKNTYDVVIDKRRIGRTLLDDGNPVLITADNLAKYDGQTYGIFAAPFCVTSHGDVCSVCMGKTVSEYPDSLGSMVSEMPSTMMAVMMGSAHAKELKTTPLDVEGFLR